MARFVIVALLLSLTACASTAKLRLAELEELAAMLPGRWDNTAQQLAEDSSGAGKREAIALAIVPVYAPFLGDHVFYAQEMSAEDPRRVFGQRLFVLEVVGDDQLVQRTLALADPGRWRNGHENSDLFKSLMPQDVRGAGGCPIEWSKTGDGFAGATPKGRCAPAARAELTPLEYAVGIDDGRRADDSMYRFRRAAVP
jgi:hypothetical protein